MLTGKNYFIVLLCILLFANAAKPNAFEIKNDSLVQSQTHSKNTIISFPNAPLEKTGMSTKKKLISSIFAFPFPFGFMGAHRVMLGTKPWVPVFYVATCGGCFGLLPLIDFFAITLSKDIAPYENNPHIFMWMKQK